jgi:hypothetical protein
MSDVIEIQTCPICGENLDVNSGNSVDYNGKLIHKKCVRYAEAQNGTSPEGHNPNNSYT